VDIRASQALALKTILHVAHQVQAVVLGEFTTNSDYAPKQQ
jgi:hypothetical protein